MPTSENKYLGSELLPKYFKKLMWLFVLFSASVFFAYIYFFNQNKNIYINFIKEMILVDEKKHTKLRVKSVEILYNAIKKEYPKEDVEKILESYIKSYNQKYPNNYIFVLKIYNLNGGQRFAKMLINPNVKKLEGKFIDSSYMDVKGNRFREYMLQIARTSKEGFVKYYYKNPKSGEVEEKYTYVYYIPELKLLIASGVYGGHINAVIKYAENRILLNNNKILAVFVLFVVLMFIAMAYFYRQIVDDMEKEFFKNKKIIALLQKVDIELINGNEYPEALKELFKLIGVKKFGVFDKNRCLIIGDAKFASPIKMKDYYFVFEGYSNKYKIIINHLVFVYVSMLEREKYEKNLEKTINEQIKQLREKDLEIISHAKLVSLGELVGNISHQWKQPLNALQNHINNLLLDIKINGGNEELKSTLKKMEEIISQLSNIINVFKSFYIKNPVKEKINIKNMLQNISLILDLNKIKLSLDIQECYILAHKSELDQVVLAILSNSMDEFKRKKINGEIDMKAYCDGDNVIIEIEDNAGGIPEENIDKIFEKSFSTKNSSGLGLAFSKKIVEESLKGSIRVENTQKGAKFVIVLPKAKD